MSTEEYELTCFDPFSFLDPLDQFLLFTSDMSQETSVQLLVYWVIRIWVLLCEVEELYRAESESQRSSSDHSQSGGEEGEEEEELTSLYSLRA